MSTDWKTHGEIMRLESPWVTVLAERWQDTGGTMLDYWRVQRADSAIVLPLQGDTLLLPAPAFRPGVGQSTLDFPGGRVSAGVRPADMVPGILQRELGLDRPHIVSVNPINQVGWAVDSSFSSQRLWGFVARVDADWQPPGTVLRYPATAPKGGIDPALQIQLTCLQCRALLLAWLDQAPFNYQSKGSKT
jgi:hypothetical protein